MEKVKKLVKSVAWYFQLGRGLSYAGIILGGVGSILIGLWYLFGDADPLPLTSLEIGEMSFHFNSVFTVEAKPALLFLIAICLLGTVTCVLQYKIFDAICDILDPIRKGRPFHAVVVEQTRRLGWLTIASGVTGFLTNSLLGFLLPRLIDLNSIFVNGHIVSVGYTPDGGDIGFIIYALLMFLLSAIFQQGAELQQLSDETL